MFSFGSKKPAENGAKKRNLAQLGFLDMGLGNQLDLDQIGDMEDDDDDLEAELAALTVGSSSKPKKGRKQLVSEKELNEMVSHSLKDIPSDAEVSDIDDDEVEGELNDLLEGSGGSSPEPEEEVKKPEVSQTSNDSLKIVEERLAMYLLAEKNAKLSGDARKTRMFGRGIKTLQGMLKDIKSGRSIIMDDVPQVLAPSTKTVVAKPVEEYSANTENVESLPADVPASIPVSKPQVLPRNPTLDTANSVSIPADAPLILPRTAPPIPPRASAKTPSAQPPLESNPNLTTAKTRRNEYKQNAVQAKRLGDQAKAIQLVRLVKICDQLIETAEQGGTPDWNLLPPSLQVINEPIVQPEPKLTVEEFKQEAVEPEASASSPANPPADPPVSTVPQPRTTLEALEQRLAKYQSSMDQAQAEGNSSKVRRLGRIVKQYQAAIKASKAGRPVAFDELPDPPGFPPIPGAPGKVEPVNNEVPAFDAAPAAVTRPAAAAVAPASASTTDPAKSPLRPALLPAASPPSTSQPKKTALATRQDKQLAMLLERQTLFKQAALEAKRSGEMNLAKEYLRLAKGIDPLITANKCGLPVDMDTLPIPPQMKAATSLRRVDAGKREKTDQDFEVLSSEECTLAPSLGIDSGLLVQLETDLLTQLKVCTTNKDHYKQMGDVANANRFDQLALFTRKDLDVVRSTAMRGDAIPRWKNEIRKFSIVKCCTDLKGDDMEINILRGLSYNVPNHKTIDTYVKFEIPIPNSDTPFKEKTTTIHNTNNPEYNQTFQMNFNRQSRTLLRIFKGKNVKFEVWSKGYVRFCPCIRSVFHSRLILTNRGNVVFIVLISIRIF